MSLLVHDARDKENNVRPELANNKSKRYGKPGVRRQAGKPLGNITNAPNAMVDEEGPEPAKKVVVSKKVAKTAKRKLPAESKHCPPPPSPMNTSDDTNEAKSSRFCPVAGCDIANRDDPQFVTEYVQEIFDDLHATEGLRRPKTDYMTEQPDINGRMRTILIDWLIEVHIKFKLKPETMYLTVNIIDRFLSVHQVARSRLQLVGCTAMLLASKYEEIYSPEVRDFVYISDKAYSKEEILTMEQLMINALHFRLTVPTKIHFAERFIRVSGNNSDVRHLVNFFMELSLLEYKQIKYLPSEVAASCLFLALKFTKYSGWTGILEAHTRYTLDKLEDCVRDIYQVLIDKNPREKAVRKKYSSARFGSVAKMDFKKQAEC